MARIDVVHVPYKGSGPAEIDLAGGNVQFMVDALPAALPNVKSRRTLALATTGIKRTPILPDSPTVSESGLPGYEFTTWWGIAAPADTPSFIIEKLNSEIVRIMSRADVKEFVLVQGAESRPSSAREFADYLKTQLRFFARIVADAGIKPE